MNVKVNWLSDTWAQVLDAARNTINKPAKGKEPSSDWKRKILFSEHSPIRKINIDWTWEGIKSWISVHFVRHKIGIDHFVSTQRNDRGNPDRDLSPQATPVNHNAKANASAIMFISRKRLCKMAHPETREAWKDFLLELEKVEPELVSVCVPECVYRNGICPEFKSCGYNFTKDFEQAREIYIQQHKDQVSR